MLLEARLQARKRTHRPHISIKLKLFPQRHVDALKSAGDRRGHRTFQTNMRSFKRLDDVRRQHLAGFGNDAGVQIGALPIDGNASRVDGAHRGISDFRADTVAGD